MQEILLVEDNESLNRGITLSLQNAGYQVSSAFTLSQGREFWQNKEFSLVICDITLPDGSGLDLGREVRESSSTYLLYLTALDGESDIVNGYAAGADDYITKPFSLMVLVSKVQALMRRLAHQEERLSVLVSGELELNPQEMKVYRKGQEVFLSKKELQLLMYLLENAGKILSKESILERIWDSEGQFVDDNTVTVNVSRLKNKLGTDEISNVRGLGYIWTGKVVKK